MLVDILIAVLVISALFRGKEIGFVRQLFSTRGFFGGLFIGALLEPHIVRLVHTSQSRSIVTIVTTLGCALILLSVGEYIGIRLKHKVLLNRINSIDNVLGSLLSIVSILISIWLTASILNSLPIPSVQNAIRSSWIVARLDAVLPSAPNVIGDLGSLIDPNGFPQVFLGNEPSPTQNVPLPNLGALEAAVTADRASVVKVEGQGCGGIVEGSGFIVGNGLVATNAHVVAGIKHSYVDADGGTYSAKAIWFDPNLDFAVLRVPGLYGKALTLSSAHVSNATPGAVMGYPGGGPFTAGAAAVLEQFDATGKNIYGDGNTNREIYEIQATVIPGNSGGPLVNEAGSVIGIVFAESTTYSHVGYALAMTKVINELAQAEQRDQVTTTGSCAQ
jgi:S1-C subfamily serine protease